jgi:DNA-binding winged helix-turn-helix (wHTH) protein
MADRAEVSGSIRFAPFELMLEPEELRRNGIRVKVSGQALQVLIVLASEPGRLVTRNTFIRYSGRRRHSEISNTD